jgi:NAD+ kinase
VARRAAIVAHPARAGVDEALRELVSGLESRGWIAVTERVHVDRLGLGIDAVDWDDPGADLIITLGGAGTLLAAARRLAGRAVPIFGINHGGLGFLTATSPNSMWPALEEALDGTSPTETRMTLCAEVLRDGIEVTQLQALNDAVLHKGRAVRVLELELSVDGEPVGRYTADGLILSTPTGSTGYNLSAGGPILVPTSEALVITSICAHSLAFRPIVLTGDQTVEVRIADGEEGAFLVIDGQVEEPLRREDAIRIRKGANDVILAGLRPGSYFSRLRGRLMWGERAHAGE